MALIFKKDIEAAYQGVLNGNPGQLKRLGAMALMHQLRRGIVWREEQEDKDYLYPAEVTTITEALLDELDETDLSNEEWKPYANGVNALYKNLLTKRTQ